MLIKEFRKLKEELERIVLVTECNRDQQERSINEHWRKMQQENAKVLREIEKDVNGLIKDNKETFKELMVRVKIFDKQYKKLQAQKNSIVKKAKKKKDKILGGKVLGELDNALNKDLSEVLNG